MTIRSIWIISILPETCGNVLYTRKFPTVERRARLFHKDNYTAVPTSESISKGLMLALGLSPDSKNFVDWRDKSCSSMKMPVMTIQIGHLEIGPIVVVEQSSCLLCCLPLIEELGKHDFLSNSSISLGFSVLIGILHFLGPQAVLKTDLTSRFIELDNYLALSLPFGMPSDTDPMNIVAFYNSSSSSKKQTPTKQVSYKGKLAVTFEIAEYIRCTQWGQSDFEPVVDLYGSIIVKVESDGFSTINEISLTLENENVERTLELNSIIIHPSAQAFVSTNIVSSVPKRLWFKPLPHPFTLCFYTANCPEPPISGNFKLKGQLSVELSIALKLSDKMRNSFQFCDVFIPFFHQGPIQTFEFKSSQGFVVVSEDKHSMKWNLGSKFISKTREAFLTSKIELRKEPLPVHNDPFCVGKNAYIQLSFKEMDHTLSGCTVEPKSIVISPSLKMKVVTEKTLASTEFRIWNTFGDVPFPLVPKNKWPKES